MKKHAAGRTLALAPKPKPKYYGVHRGLDGNSVHREWAAAQQQCHGVERALVRSFKAEADAVFFSMHGHPRLMPPTPLAPTFSYHAPDTIAVYTDGSALRNGSADARAGLGVFFGVGHPLNTSAVLTQPPLTNQRAELKAIIVALYLVRTQGEAHFPASLYSRVALYVDNKYAINCATTWRRAWEASNFRDNSIQNRDLLTELFSEMDAAPRLVAFHWVKGHSGVYGNEAADALATTAAAAHL